MSQLLEDVVLGTDLDGAGKNINNVAAMTPAPANLVETTDPRMSDGRVPLDGSVTDATVAATAAIAQSKLNLNGQVPAPWLGTSPGQAAAGNLTEYLAKKGQPNGYAGLDSSGKIPAAQMTPGAGLGTVTSVGLTVPGVFTMSGSPSPITGAGIFAFDWISQAAFAWFGNPSPSPGPPQFNTAPLPPALIPSLDAGKVTTGTFLAALLPVALGLGGSHAVGAVPDPGDGSGGALATDYLARDMSYKAIPPASVDGTVYGPTWNGVTTKAPTQNSVYDWGHQFDFDDNGKVNVLDQGAGIPVTNASGVITSTKAAPAGNLIGDSDFQSIANKQIVPRVVSETVAAQPTIKTDQADVAILAPLTLNITSMSANLSGTPVPYQRLTIVFLDDGTPRTIAWGAAFGPSGTALPVTTVANKATTVFLLYRSPLWVCVGIDQQL